MDTKSKLKRCCVIKNTCMASYSLDAEVQNIVYTGSTYWARSLGLDHAGCDNLDFFVICEFKHSIRV